MAKNKENIFMLGLIALIIMTFSNVFLYYQNNYSKKYILNKEFSVEKGESLYNALNKIGINPNIYQRLYIKFNKNLKVEAGNYFFDGTNSFVEILEKLKKGKIDYVKVTIPEGFTINKIAEKLEKMGVVKRFEFEKALNAKKDFYYLVPENNFEGYFFPDTYYFFKNENPKYVVDKFLNRFLEKYPPQDYEDKEEFYKKLIMASIIEKEAGHQEEMDIISSVFYNRLNRNMRLQSCATIAYLFNYEKDYITYEDLKIDSVYNTYRINDLPPSPISNPGRSAMEASYNPQETEYYYFVLQENGRHYFSKNYEEHIKAKRREERGDDGAKIRVKR